MTAAQKVTVTNTGDTTSKYSLNVINPAGWTVSTGAPGADIYLLNAAFDADGAVTWSAANHAVSASPEASSATKFAGDQQGINVQSGQTRTLYLQFRAPTSTGVTSQQSVQLVVTAVAQ
jgi:hypothetical protein